MPPKKTHYNDEWEDPTRYPKLAEWICKQKDNDTLFGCKVCRTYNLKLGTMGVGAPNNHMKERNPNGDKTKHQRKIEDIRATQKSSYNCFVEQKEKDKEPSNGEDILLRTQGNHIHLKSKASIDAEIIVVLKAVMCHYSLRSIDDMGDLFRKLDKNSHVFKDFQLGRTKAGYMINYGLAPFYKDKFIHTVRDAEFFVLCFDESFNRISHKKQMDVHVIFFDEAKGCINRNYIGSAFMGHADAQSCLNSLIEVIGDLDWVHKLVQIGMDGPNVNWSLIRLLNQRRKEIDPESPELLNIGSCGVHVLHDAVQSANVASGWNTDKVLKNSYSIFKKSPARRADYIDANDLHDSHIGTKASSLFPLKFCGTRWLENTKAIARFNENQQYILTYFNYLIQKKKLSLNDDRFTLLNSFIRDPISPAIMQFNLCIMSEIEPFLRDFQAEKPLAVFLFERMKVIIMQLMKRLIRPEVIEASTLRKLLQPGDDATKLKVFTDPANLLGAQSIDIGFGAKGVLKKLNTVQSTKGRAFCAAAKDFLMKLLNKLGERCPLKYPLTLNISTLSPTQMSSASNKTLERRFDSLLTTLVESSYINVIDADKAKNQYSEFLRDKTISKKLQDFDFGKDRLDTFYHDQLYGKEETKELFKVVKIILILSHGQARVESGFSINEKILVENMHEESLVAQRLVYEGVMQEGGYLQVEVSDTMRRYIRQASSKQKLSQKDAKKKKSEADFRREERKRLSKEISEASAAKKAAVEQLKQQIDMYEDTIRGLKKKL